MGLLFGLFARLFGRNVESWSDDHPVAVDMAGVVAIFALVAIVVATLILAAVMLW